MSTDKYRAALDAAAKQLSCRALSAKMLREKLIAKGHDEEAADYALAWLAERSLLSDAQFAESVVRSYTRRGYGAARIRQELQRRGFSRRGQSGRGRYGQPSPPPAADAFGARKAAARRPFRPERRSIRRSPPFSGAAFRGATSKTPWRNTARPLKSTNNFHPFRTDS